MECSESTPTNTVPNSRDTAKTQHECAPTIQHAADNKTKPALSLSLQPLVQQATRIKRRDTATSTDTACSNDSDGSSLSLRLDSPVSSPNTSPELSPVDIANMKPALFSLADSAECPEPQSHELLSSPALQQGATPAPGAVEKETETKLELELELGLEASRGQGQVKVSEKIPRKDGSEDRMWKLASTIRGVVSWVSGEVSKVWCLPGMVWGGASGWMSGWGGNDVGGWVGEDLRFWDVGAQMRSWEVKGASLSGIEGREEVAAVGKPSVRKQEDEKLEGMVGAVGKSSARKQECEMAKEKTPPVLASITVGENNKSLRSWEVEEVSLMDGVRGEKLGVVADVVERSVGKQAGEVVKVKPAPLLMPTTPREDSESVKGAKEVTCRPVVVSETRRPNPSPKGNTADPPPRVQAAALPSSPGTHTATPSAGNTKKRPAELDSPEQPTKTGKRKRKKSQQTTPTTSSPPEPEPHSKQPPSPPLQQHERPVPVSYSSSTPKPQPNRQGQQTSQAKSPPPPPPPSRPPPAQKQPLDTSRNPPPKKRPKRPNPASSPEPSSVQPHEQTVQAPTTPSRVQEHKEQQATPPTPSKVQEQKGQQPPEIPQFCGKVILDQHQKAYMYGRIASSPFSPSIYPLSSSGAEFGPHHLVLWTDGSWTPDKTASKTAGIGIVYRQYNADGQALPWQEHAYTLTSPPHHTHPLSTSCETLAIEAALSLTLHRLLPANPQTTQLTILSDAKTNLRVISHLRRKTPSDPFAEGAALSQALHKRGVQTTLRWVPGHAGVEGNDRADRAARLARVFGPSINSCSGGRVGGEEEVVTMTRMPVPLLERFEELLETIRQLEGERDKALTARLRRVEMLGVVESLGRVAREEGWVCGP